MTNSPPLFEMVVNGLIIISEACRGINPIKLIMLIDYRLQKKCILWKCQIDEVKGIQLTKGNLVVNVLFMQVIKF
jgi:hypothetical protein